MWLLILTTRSCNRKFNNFFTQINVRLPIMVVPYWYIHRAKVLTHTPKNKEEKPFQSKVNCPRTDRCMCYIMNKFEQVREGGGANEHV